MEIELERGVAEDLVEVALGKIKVRDAADRRRGDV